MNSPQVSASQPLFFFPLSAKAEPVLRLLVREFLEYLQDLSSDDLLERISYTLHVGREQMDVRLMIVAASLDALHLELSRLLDSDAPIGVNTRKKSATGQDQNAASEQIGEANHHASHEDLSRIWLAGGKVDWALVYNGKKVQRINLPAYPFNNARYWITESRGLRGSPGIHAKDRSPALLVTLDEESRPKAAVTPVQHAPSQVNDGAAAKDPAFQPRDFSKRDATMPLDNQSALSIARMPTLGELQDELSDGLAAALFMEGNDIDLDETFFELGVESVSGVQWIKALNEKYGLSLKVSAIYDTPTLRTFSEFFFECLRTTPGALDLVAVPPAASETTVSSSDKPREEPVVPRSGHYDSLFSSEPESASLVIVEEAAAATMIAANMLSEELAFSSLGLDGAALEKFANRLASRLAIKLSAEEIKRAQTIGGLVSYVGGRSGTQVGQEDVHEAREDAQSASRPEPIAIIGMAGQYPMASSKEELWQRLLEGTSCVGTLPYARWGMKEKNTDLYEHLGVLDDADKFDALFFNISPKEARLMEPQQRVFLQNAWACLEDAGYAPSSLSETRCGVYVGCSGSGYGIGRINEASTHALMGHTTSILPARVSYHLNLRGPCMAIDTACSSSLVAMAEACTSLAFGSCDMALTGGVNVFASPVFSQMAIAGGMLSADGRCFTFDHRANGFVPSEGVGVFLLKRLSDARRDGDRVYAVVSAWGVNHDGRTNGMTAPSVVSQTALECEVYERFNIDPATITYAEAHGTGTRLGDPIEVQGLNDAFRKFTDKKAYCALGSVKSNLGHTLGAAGAAGVLKAVLSIQNRCLPPTINFEKLNEEIPFADGPFFVNDKLKEWEVPDGQIRRACVSSFSYSGTNAHIVLEECPSAKSAREASAVPSSALILLSARTEQQLIEQASLVARHARSMKSKLSADGGDLLRGLHDLAFTLQVGRDAILERLGFVASSLDEVADILEAYVSGRDPQGVMRANVKQGRRNLDRQTAKEAGERASRIDGAFDVRDLRMLLAEWMEGVSLDWYRMRGSANRISLPTYPFSKKRYWVGDDGQADAVTFVSQDAKPIDEVAISSPDDLDRRFASHLRSAGRG